MRDNPRENFRVFYLDVEYLERPADLIVEIMEKTGNVQNFGEKFKDILASFFKHIDEVQGLDFKIQRHFMNDDWENKGNRVFENLTKESYTPVFVLDELPSMLQNMINTNSDGIHTAKLFLQWMRSLRIVHNIRFVICGSIGIDHILHQCDAVSSINYLKRITVKPLTNDQSIEMIKQLLDGFSIKYDDVIAQKIFDKIGVGIPFFLKIMVQYIDHEIRDVGSELNCKILDAAYGEMLSVGGRGYFEHYFSRLDSYYEVDSSRMAKSILDYLAIYDSATLDELKIFMDKTDSEDRSKLAHFMEKLENDFYIHSDGMPNKYQFYTKILRDIWKKKRGL